MKKILFISGSLGLGHIARDMAIANELRSQVPGIDIHWIAYEPALSVLTRAGEKIVTESSLYCNENEQAESTSKGPSLNLQIYVFKSLGKWLFRNTNIVKKVLKESDFDLVIGDETYELDIALILHTLKLDIPFIMIYDFLGMNAISKNPFTIFVGYLINRIWSLDYKTFTKDNNLAIFIGEPEDIPDKKFGFAMPNKREHGKKYYKFVGNILPFNPKDYVDKKGIRQKLGYSDRPLVLCSIGGTSVGKELLELCAEAYSFVKKKILDLHMVLVCGPRVQPEKLNIPKEIDIRNYIPNLYEHFAASDLAVVQGGGTTTLELLALKKPFIYFTLIGHTEQESVSQKLQRHNAGIKMSYLNTSPRILAETIIENINAKVDYKDIPLGGAKNTVKLLRNYL